MSFRRKFSFRKKTQLESDQTVNGKEVLNERQILTNVAVDVTINNITTPENVETVSSGEELVSDTMSSPIENSANDTGENLLESELSETEDKPTNELRDFAPVHPIYIQ
jgi:hypothetical protein